MFDWTTFGLTFFAFLAGAINSVAGGGTLLTFPALLVVLQSHGPELAAVYANATSTVALMPGSVAGAAGYRTELWASRRYVVRLILPSIIGGYVGARLVSADKATFAVLVPWLILTATLLFAIQGAFVRRLYHKFSGSASNRRVSSLLVFVTLIVSLMLQFIVAVYGGYFGAGIGIMMLSVLGYVGIDDIHCMNAVKTILAAAINISAVLVFILEGLVCWDYALPMTLSAIVGGYLGARLARSISPYYVRLTVVLIGIGLTIYYFAR